MGSIVHIAMTIPPAETEVCRTPENTTWSDRVLPISIFPLNFVRQQTKCYFSVEICKKNMAFVDIQTSCNSTISHNAGNVSNIAQYRRQTEISCQIFQIITVTLISTFI